MAKQNTTADFDISYSGESVADNTIDVRDLAPALIALSELFTRANAILNGDKVQVNLKVRATKPGSFEIELILAQILLTASQSLTPDMIANAANLMTLILGVPKIGESLFSLIKKLKGKRPTEIKETPDGVVIKANNIELSISTSVFKVWKDTDSRKLSQEVIEPLLRTGIEQMIIKEGGKQVNSINKEDAEGFIYTGDNPEEGTTEYIIPSLRLRLISTYFDTKKSKWKFDDGSSGKGGKFYQIEDEKFLRDVRDRRVQFGWGDYLVCRVKVVQRVTDIGIKMEQTILKVQGKYKPGEQITFDNMNNG